MSIDQLAPSASELTGIFGEWAAAGISVIPIRADGTKRPAEKSWNQYQQRIAQKVMCMMWTQAKEPCGIAAIGGVVSMGLEIIDFDDSTCFSPWADMVAGIVCRLPIVETAGGGYHVYYRCEEVCRNSKIALDANNQVRIETRGEGGYVIAPGGPIVHASGLPYVQVSGPLLPEVPFITTDERKRLWGAAREFDQRPNKWQDLIDKRLKELRPTKPVEVGAPWEAYNRGAKWADVLEPHGWTSRDGINWTRPGKTDGSLSAHVRIARDGNEILVVFSSNASPLDPGNWSKFNAYAALNHRNDRKAAARQLRKEGWGS